MNFIYYKSEHYPVPAHWDEMTEKQFLAVVNILFSMETIARGRLRIFKALSGMSWWTMLKITGLMRFKNIDKYWNRVYVPAIIKKYFDQCERLAFAIEECTAFLFEPEISMTRQQLPFFRGRYGPASELRNITMAEFCNTEHYFLQYKAAGSDADLNMLVAALYRQEKKHYDHYSNPAGDHREKFNPNVLEAEAQKVASWPPPVKKAINMFYEGARNKKIGENDRVFGGASGEESLYGLWSLMRSVAKAGHFGDFDKVEDQYVDTILMEMNEVVVESERLEAQLERHKN